MRKIKLEIMKPYITQMLNSIIPLEDDIVIEYVFSQLEEKNVSISTSFKSFISKLNYSTKKESRR